MNQISRLILGATTVIVLSIGLFCFDAHADDEKWEYVFAPYLQSAGIDGTVGIHGVDTEINASFSDIIKNLEFGFMGHFEASKGSWIVLSELLYTGLGTATSTPPANIDFNQWMVEGGMGRRINQNFEVIFGGRFNRLNGKLRLEGPLGLQLERSQDWFDPYVGGRVHLPLSKKAEVMVRGDIGGFGVGSDFAWNITPSFVYKVKDSMWMVVFYRWWDMDYENGDNGFLYDVNVSGPGLGLAFRF